MQGGLAWVARMEGDRASLKLVIQWGCCKTGRVVGPILASVQQGLCSEFGHKPVRRREETGP
jgi:hypothetical protein